MSEKLCLKWNDYQENVTTAFGSFRGDIDFSDVTLASSDGQQVEAHKVILAASSPFFQDIFKRNKHSHPFLYMRGVKSEDLVAIIDFLYCGEANVFQENLDSFLAIAEELKLKGLMGNNDKKKKEEESNEMLDLKRPMPSYKMEHNEPKNLSRGRSIVKNVTKPHNEEGFAENKTIAILPSPINSLSDGLLEIEETVKSMMEKSESSVEFASGGRRAFSCKVCGKEGQNTDIKRHIESSHIEGISVPCNMCDKTCRSRDGLRKHISVNHKNT